VIARSLINWLDCVSIIGLFSSLVAPAMMQTARLALIHSAALWNRQMYYQLHQPPV
jgi:hypothetical protein